MIDNSVDLTIIGGGPVGMYAAFYASLRQMKVEIIDALPDLGGQLQALYPEKYIYDIPGYVEVKASDLVDNLKKQMDTVIDNKAINLNERVEYVRRRDEDNILEICTDTLCHYTKTVLITAGKGAFQPRTLGIENEQRFSNIHYFVNDIDQFIDKKVVIFGGGDSAVDWANMLSEVAKEVSIVHRRDIFRAHEYSVEQMNNSSVQVFTSYTLDHVDEDGGKISKVYIKNNKENKVQELEVDDTIVLFGVLSSLGPIETWDLTLENRALLVDSKRQTNIAGIYAAGDACIYPGKVKMIACGFGEATVAVNSIYQFLNPGKKNTPVFSSALKNKK